MDVLPDEPARGHLLDELASLILAAGHDTFLVRPLVEPCDRFFPDPWTPDGPGIEHLLFRLLGYAGLEHLEQLRARLSADAGHGVPARPAVATSTTRAIR